MYILIFNAWKCKGFSFYMKNKLNPEIFNEKKKFVKKNIFLSLMTKNLNWEILTENLVTFKMWGGVKDEKFYYYGGSLKNVIFLGGFA